MLRSSQELFPFRSTIGSRPPTGLELCDHAEAKLLICDLPFAALIGESRERLRDVREYIVVSGPQPGWKDYADWHATQPRSAPDVVITSEQDVLQLYTSGTTGQPRGVVLTSCAVASGVTQLSTVACLHTDDRFLMIMPMFHAAGIMEMLHVISCGATLVIQQDFAADATVDALAEQGITATMMVPTMIQRCLAEISDSGKRTFEKLRLVIYGASPIAEDTLRRALDVFCCDFAQRYGTTETLSLAWLDPTDHQVALQEKPELLRSAGRPLPRTKIRVVGANGQDLAIGERGEFVVSGPQLMRGYWKSEDDAVFLHGEVRWIRTGDVGYVDAEGYIFICDRVKDIIVSGGENIYPREIEEVLLEHPEVREAAVIGIPDAVWGESVKALLVLRPGAVVSEESLISYCREHLAGFKTPRSVSILPELPRNSAGKVLKYELRKPYWRDHDRRI